jgi:hypothetical protein
MPKRSESSVREGQAAKKEPLTGVAQKQKIDFSDIPEASTGQLRAMRRVGRPPIGAAARQLIAIKFRWCIR